jgi:N-methylhydantoinase A
MHVHVGVDVGGTFTDLAVNIPDQNRALHYKLPSTPGEPQRAIIDGIAAVLAEHGISPADIVRLSHGTTVGTNALIQRRIGRVAVVTTEGFRDLLEIGRQVRPKVYDIHMDFPPPLVPRELRFEVPERYLADGRELRPLDEERLAAVAGDIAAAQVDCVVVCFLHSYAYRDHETRAVEILKQALPPRTFVLASTSVYGEFREYERFSTAALNGALLTVMDHYLSGFTQSVQELGVVAPPKISQSSGGLMSVDMARRLPIRASLSGPAAGVLGSARRAKLMGRPNVITLDVGGTSADVSLIRQGRPSEVHSQVIEGFPIRLPALDVSAVGAGGGSIAWIDTDELLKVGPMSAGADPGPACYDKGGESATVTDANVLLGRLSGEALLDGRMPIRKDLAERAVARLAESLGLDLLETALGIVRVASATVVKAIRKISVERGHAPAEFALFAYGGAGPLFAVDVARELGISTIIVPMSPGILCAEGLQDCDLTADFVRTALVLLDGGTVTEINAVREHLIQEARDWFGGEEVAAADRRLAWTVDLRYRGQNFELAIPIADRPLTGADIERLNQAFHDAHEQTYGFASPDEPVEFVNMKVKAIGILRKPEPLKLDRTEPGRHIGTRSALFAIGSWSETPIYRRDALAAGQRLQGPAIIEQLDATVLIYPDDSAMVDAWGNLIITLS